MLSVKQFTFKKKYELDNIKLKPKNSKLIMSEMVRSP